MISDLIGPLTFLFVMTGFCWWAHRRGVTMPAVAPMYEGASPLILAASMWLLFSIVEAAVLGASALEIVAVLVAIGVGVRVGIAMWEAHP